MSGSPGDSQLRVVAFWIIVAVQVLVLVGMVGLKERSLANGTIVRLAVKPVDPTDLARGSYVALRYDISDTSAMVSGLGIGDEVVVGLRNTTGSTLTDTGAWTSADDVSDPVFIRGVVTENTASSKSLGDSIEVNFNAISSYYDDGAGARTLEQVMAEGAVAIVSLDERGNGTLCEVVAKTDTRVRDSCELD